MVGKKQENQDNQKNQKNTQKPIEKQKDNGKTTNSGGPRKQE